jgi:kumamolisin
VLAERYFHTELHDVVQAGYGRRYRNVAPFTVPGELRSVAVALSGLDTTVHVTEPHTMSRAARTRVEAASPAAVSTSTPGPNPSPDPTLSPEFSPEEDYTANTGYGPAIWATAYDYPVQHGYGGSGEAIGSVINEDFANSDAAAEIKLYGIPRTGGQYRIYTDGSFASTDTAGESTLDAEILETLAPAADYYEYLTQYFDALGIEGAYAQVVSDNVVATVNSSFGGCETDDPSFEYGTNYLAMQGAAKGITFVAASGDTGARGCGIQVINSASGGELGVQAPCADVYFVCAGGTQFLAITSDNSYSNESAWTGGGGGVSVLEPLPDWQAQTANVVTTGRNVPDIAMTADDVPPDVCFVIVYNNTVISDGGTSVASPMFAALQTEIDQAQHSRNGFVNPRLYDVGNSAESFAFRDVTTGGNGSYFAGTGYDNTTGFGSPRGFELAGAE